MYWAEAWQALNNLQVGTNLNTKRSTYRYIKAKTDSAFEVLVGAKSKIVVTEEMLQTCFYSLSDNHGYSRECFKDHYPNQCETKPCYVHVIGQLFVKAGIAVSDQAERQYYSNGRGKQQ